LMSWLERTGTLTLKISSTVCILLVMFLCD
jgi:hypothetical protein